MGERLDPDLITDSVTVEWQGYTSRARASDGGHIENPLSMLTITDTSTGQKTQVLMASKVILGLVRDMVAYHGIAPLDVYPPENYPEMWEDTDE